MSILGRWTHPVARVAHECDQCRRTVAPGERYHRWHAHGDAGFYTVVWCAQCRQCADDLMDLDHAGEDEDGHECLPNLPDVDWADVAAESSLWALRAVRFRARWVGQPYPV